MTPKSPSYTYLFWNKSSLKVLLVQKITKAVKQKLHFPKTVCVFKWTTACGFRKYRRSCRRTSLGVRLRKETTVSDRERDRERPGREVFRWAALCFRCLPTRYCGSAYDRLCLDKSTPPITTHSTFHSFTKEQARWREWKKDRFQYQPVIWLLRLDRIMPYRQTLRNLLLMKYDMCANGAPPPIQQPVITFRNKYTKRLLKKKKKERQLLYFASLEWVGSNRRRVAPLRVLTFLQVAAPSCPSSDQTQTFNIWLESFFTRHSSHSPVYVMCLSRGMVGVVGRRKHVSLTRQSAKRFALELFREASTIHHSGVWLFRVNNQRSNRAVAQCRRSSFSDVVYCLWDIFDPPFSTVFEGQIQPRGSCFSAQDDNLILRSSVFVLAGHFSLCSCHVVDLCWSLLSFLLQS